MTHFLMGALNKTTNLYEYPKIAEKNNKYICIDCKNDVILKKGNIKVHHFAHYKSENPCSYYNNPGESQVHKDAKMLLKSLLDAKRNICFTRKCNICNCNNSYKINDYNENTNIYIEHTFNYNNSIKIADIAYLDNNNIIYIFEICYRHKTQAENRPEPWFEIDAETLINDINIQDISANITIKCIRNKKCDTCVENELFKQKLELEKKQAAEAIAADKLKKELIETKLQEYLSKELTIKKQELMAKIRLEIKKCKKCHTFRRCDKCSDKISKKYYIELKILLENAKLEFNTSS